MLLFWSFGVQSDSFNVDSSSEHWVFCIWGEEWEIDVTASRWVHFTRQIKSLEVLNRILILIEPSCQALAAVMEVDFTGSVFFRITWCTWCPKNQWAPSKKHIRNTCKASELFSWYRACYFSQSLLPSTEKLCSALVWWRVYFGVWTLKILWKSPVYSLILHCFSVADLHVVLLIACFSCSLLMSWGSQHDGCWSVCQNLREKQEKIWQSWLVHIHFLSFCCHRSELEWLLGHGVCW